MIRSVFEKTYVIDTWRMDLRRKEAEAKQRNELRQHNQAILFIQEICFERQHSVTVKNMSFGAIPWPCH